jgi:AcrR family transcriptional regulator
MRLSAEAREKQIVEGAVRFFAERGFAGNTRDLARRLGVTQPLLFRYFPSKEALINRVYREVFLARWNPEWERRIVDRSRPLRERLVEFYGDYTKTIFRYEWIRIYMFSGLKDGTINRRYIRLIEERILKRIVEETRFECGLPGTDEEPFRELEMEIVWNLHGGIFYVGVRRYIYEIPLHGEIDEIIEACVDFYLDGALAAMTRLMGRPDAPARG